MSSENAAIKDETMQDMTRPLPEYYISSSHNVRSIDASVYRNDVVLMRCSIDRRTSLAANSKARVLSRDTFELCSKGADASNVRFPDRPICLLLLQTDSMLCLQSTYGMETMEIQSSLTASPSLQRFLLEPSYKLSLNTPFSLRLSQSSSVSKFIVRLINKTN